MHGRGGKQKQYWNAIHVHLPAGVHGPEHDLVAEQQSQEQLGLEGARDLTKKESGTALVADPEQEGSSTVGADASSQSRPRQPSAQPNPATINKEEGRQQDAAVELGPGRRRHAGPSPRRLE